MTSPSPIEVNINGHTWYRVEGTSLDPANTYDERDVRACGGHRPWIVGSYADDYKPTPRPPNRSERRGQKPKPWEKNKNAK